MERCQDVSEKRQCCQKPNVMQKVVEILVYNGFGFKSSFPEIFHSFGILDVNHKKKLTTCALC